MTVSTQTYKSGPYAGDGVSTEFRVDFPFLENAHLQVTRESSGGSQQLILESDYTVSGAGQQAGQIQLSQALQIGQTLLIKRHIPFTQLADYVQGDAFPAESHEMALDKLTMIAQQLKGEVDLSVKVADDDQGSIEFPASASRKNKLLGFDEQGLPNAITVSNGLLMQDHIISVKPHIGILSNSSGVSVLMGNGLDVYNNAIVVKLGKGLEFDEQAKIRIQEELIEAIKTNVSDIIDLKGLIANLSKRIAELEFTGGGEVAIYIGEGLKYDEQGQLTIKPSIGIKVDGTGVSIKLGQGLEVDSHGNVQVSETLQGTINGKANQSDLDAKMDGNDVAQILSNRFAIIYPNGGSEASPANIESNKRYTLVHPFPGRFVECRVEIFFNNAWGDPGWVTWSSTTPATGVGAKASQLISSTGNMIVLQTGDNATIDYIGCNQGNPFGEINSGGTVKARVLVWCID